MAAGPLLGNLGIHEVRVARFAGQRHAGDELTHVLRARSN